MTKVVIAGYYGFENEDGMNYIPLPQQIFELAGIGGWGMQDVTSGSQFDPQDGRRVWMITGVTTNGLAALEANSLCEIAA